MSGDCVVDEENNEVPSQRLSTGESVTLPPYGLVTLFLEMIVNSNQTN
jgi:hypothetical protein